MFKIAIALLQDSYCSSISGLIDVFQIANTHAHRLPKHSFRDIEWSLFSRKGGESISLKGGLTLQSKESLDKLGNVDFIFLPAFFYPGTVSLQKYYSSHAWLIEKLPEMASTGVKIAANCTSTFLLAEAGLLDNKQATTTWWLEKQFRKKYPNVELMVNQAVSSDEGIYCAGAMTAYHNLGIKMVEEYFSPDIANLCASTMLINRSNSTQTPYLSLNTPITSEDTLISKAQYWLQNHLKTCVNFQELARELDVSQRTLIRRFKLATGITPLQYHQNVRIEQAKHLLTHTPLPLEEIVDQIGYNDSSSFYRLFKAKIGLTPSNYRQKFGLHESTN